MRDFLDHLAARSLEPTGDLRPQLRSRFETGRDDEATTGPDEGDEAVALTAASARLPTEALPPAAQLSNESELAARLARLERLVPNPVAPPPAARSEVASFRELIVERDFLESARPLEHAAKLPPAAAIPASAAEAQSVTRWIPPAVPQRPRAEKSPDADAPGARELQPRPVSTAPLPGRSAIVPLSTLPPPESQRRSEPLPHSPAAEARESARRVVQITIGRLEIRAAPAAPTTGRTRPAPASDARAMSLGEFLKRRTAGGGGGAPGSIPR